MPQVITVIMIILLQSTAAQASTAKEHFWRCLLDTERRSGIDHRYLLAIKITESGHALQPIIARNTNATEDLGIMQINSIWLPQLRQHGITRRHLVHNHCINLRVATWILLRHFRRSGGDIWEAIGRYHSATPRLKKRYAAKARRVYRDLALRLAGQ